MKKQIVNKETREVLMTIELNSECPKHWARKIKAYEFDCEIELVDESQPAPVQATFWGKVKAFFGF
jgi:hypothetical protein